MCTDSGREGEYIYRLVAQMAGVKDKKQRRVWIDSQTEEEILRGIREAKDLSSYDNLANSAYLRAKEDYLMGINFSRVLTLRYGNSVSSYLKSKYQAIAVGRVMTCVLGMVVRREREIRSFVKTPFYRVISGITLEGEKFDGEWRAVEGSRYFQSPYLYKENGFKEKKHAQELIDFLSTEQPLRCSVDKIERKKENKNPPLLFNLAELQNVCSKLFKISRMRLSVSRRNSMRRNLSLIRERTPECFLPQYQRRFTRISQDFAIIPANRNYRRRSPQMGSYKTIAKTRYVNDKQITDHYAIIPTGQGLNALNSLPVTSQRVYETIVRRFLCIFCPPAVYQKVSLVTMMQGEKFFPASRYFRRKDTLNMRRILSPAEAQKRRIQKKVTVRMSPVMHSFLLHCISSKRVIY